MELTSFMALGSSKAIWKPSPRCHGAVFAVRTQCRTVRGQATSSFGGGGRQPGSEATLWVKLVFRKWSVQLRDRKATVISRAQMRTELKMQKGRNSAHDPRPQPPRLSSSTMKNEASRWRAKAMATAM